MSYEQTMRILQMYGLSKSDSEIYLYLLVHGNHKAVGIADTLGKPLWKVYFSLRRLRAKGIITVCRDRACFFYATPIEEVLKKQSSLKLENSKKIIKNKKEIMKRWTRLLSARD